MSRPLRPTTAPSHPLGELCDGADLSDQVGHADVRVSGISHDSRSIVPGDLYVALPGSRAHGAVFATEAAARGAVAVLTDPQGRARLDEQGSTLPVIVVDSPREVMATVAARLFGRPSSQLAMLGITGTNGKTTTAFLVEAGLRALGERVGTIGTIGFQLDGAPLAGNRTTVTTPESVDLQALLAVFVERGATACVMEVSSHALALHRVDGCEFDVVAFTNLGRDHLDFHTDLDDYFEAKARLFTPGRARHAVVMVTDERGRQLAQRIAAAGDPALTTVGCPDDLDGEQPDVVIGEVSTTASGGSRFVLGVRGRDHAVELDLPGEHNVRNAALALAMINALVGETAAADHDMLERAVAGLRTALVPGRMQRVVLPGGPTVVIDFAHTPQAITEAVKMAGSFERTAVVVGAGGDRDRAKRAPMGQAAAVVDLVVVTDDNPRTEDPAQIRAEVMHGARTGRAELREIGDRREAIAQALSWAGPGDLVMVLGKGHEQGQLVAGELRPFDDAQVVAELWQHRDAGGEHADS